MSKDVKKIVADTSFYVCFLDDIKKPVYLLKVVARFDFIVSKLIHDELSKSQSFNKYLRNSKKIIILDFHYNFGEILRPFLGKEEIS